MHVVSVGAFGADVILLLSVSSPAFDFAVEDDAFAESI